jgi:hypothetical protein
MPYRKSLVAPALTVNDRPPNIGIVVTPDKKPGRFRACLEQDRALLCVSRQPFLDSARKLLARGHSPQTILVMRHAGSDDVALRGSIGSAAKLTVDEHNGTVFAKWKPFRRSAGSARIANSAGELSEAPVDDSASQERRPSEGDQQAPATQTNQARMNNARR